MANQITRKNHYVPQHYLRNFSDSKGFIQRRRLLVSKEPRRPWEKLQPANVAYRYDLYTFSGNGDDDDDLERWFCNEFETNSAKVMAKVVNEERLYPADWLKLADFFALQFVRTPAFLLRNLPQWQSWEAESMKKSFEKLDNYVKRAEHPHLLEQQPNRAVPAYIDEQYPVRVMREDDLEKGVATIKVESVVGRATWRHAMRHYLASTRKILHNHRWTIIHAPRGTNWFTSDDPAIALNFNTLHDYSFGGGWGSKGSELMLPLSPKHLLYTQIGLRVPERGSEFDWLTTKKVRFLIAQHAHREIYSQTEDGEISQFRARWIKPKEVIRERKEWAKWHKEHGAAEKEIFSKA